jgi:hypothetical protein
VHAGGHDDLARGEARDDGRAVLAELAHLDGAGLHLRGLRVHDPDGGRLAAAHERGERQDHEARVDGGLQRHGGAHAHARLRRCPRHGHANRERPRHGVGAARDFADAAREAVGRVGPQEDQDLLAGTQPRELALGHRHDRFHLAVAREAQDGLAGSHHLARLGGHGDHDAVAVGGEGRVGFLVRGEGGLRASLLEARLRGGVGGLPRVVGGRTDEFLREQVGRAIELRLRERVVRLGRGELRARRFRGELRVLGVEPGKRLADAHARTGIHQARGHLAADAEGEVGLDAGAQFA